VQNEALALAAGLGAQLGSTAGAQGDVTILGGIYMLVVTGGAIPVTGNVFNVKNNDGAYAPLAAGAFTAAGVVSPIYLGPGTVNLTLGTAPTTVTATLVRLPD